MHALLFHMHQWCTWLCRGPWTMAEFVLRSSQYQTTEDSGRWQCSDHDGPGPEMVPLPPRANFNSNCAMP